MSTKVFIFGDSVALGQYDADGGWGQRLSNFLQKRYIEGRGDEFCVYNLSVLGHTSKEIKNNFLNEMKSRLWEEYPNIIIFAIGLNDSAYVHSKKEKWVPFEEFKKNLIELAERSKEFSKNIVFVGLYPIDESKMNPMPYDLDKSYSNKDVKKYDQALQAVTKENGAEYIPIFNKFEKNDYKKLLHDGAHPNSADHELIFETVRDYLLAKKII